MREILFKAKRIDNGEWVEGYYAFFKSVNGNQKMHHITTEDGKAIRIDPSTLCQFTGITDKNDKKIFENDIVETITFGYDKDYFITSVKFGAIFGIQGFHFANRRSLFYSGQANLEKIDDTEVIGNVFDNPELLENSEV